MPIYGKTPNQSKTLSGHSPLTFYSNGGNLTSYTISGNGKQDGIPSPNNIIMPTFCGVRTVNRLDYTTVESTSHATATQIPGGISVSGRYYVRFRTVNFAIGNTYTMSWKANTTSGTSAPAWRFHYSDNTYSSMPSSGGSLIAEKEVTELFLYVSTSESCVVDFTEIMLNSGSTALPYEPYGWAEKITCAGQTTPIYLGEVPTVRKIHKMRLLNPTSTTQTATGYRLSFSVSAHRAPPYESGGGFCNITVWQGDYGRIGFVVSNLSAYITQNIPEWSTIEGATQWLEENEVYIWYILANEETGIVNEPLAKIGDYADTLVYYTGAPEIPTAEGKTVLSVDTELRPSLITIQYTSGNEPIKKIYGNVSGQYKEVSKVLDASGNLVWRPPVYYDWNTIREVVRAGKAAQYYPIGSILYDNFDENTGVAYQVVGYDKHFDTALTAAGYTHSMTLCELLLTDVITFDAIEAFLYVTTAIPAGTYKFTIPNYDASYGGNKTYYFTSTAELPANSQIVMSWPYNQTPKTVTGYAPTASLTAMENTTAATGWNALTLTEWIDGTSPTAIDLGTLAGPTTQAGTSNYGDMNHIHRARYGSNNYYESGVRQYINATGAANTWWKPSNKFDRPYGSRSIAGKLNTLNQDFVNVLAYPTIKSKANTYFETTAEDGTTFTLGQDYTITTDKMFLLSPVEVGFSTTDTSIGTLLDYYVNATDATRVKIRKSNNNPYYWWLRTPYPSYAGGVRNVLGSGALSRNIASNSYGVAPACIIQ